MSSFRMPSLRCLVQRSESGYNDALYFYFDGAQFICSPDMKTFFMEGKSAGLFFCKQEVTSLKQAIDTGNKVDGGCWWNDLSFTLTNGKDETGRLMGYAVTTEPIESGNEFTLKRQLRLYRVTMAPTDNPGDVRAEILSHLAEDSYTRISLETLPADNSLFCWKPVATLIDSEVITFDHSEFQFKVTTEKDGEEPVVLNRGMAYRYASFQSVGKWMLDVDARYFNAVRLSKRTESMKVVSELLYQCPAIRQCWMEYKNLDMIRVYISSGNKEALKQGGSAAKVNGISKMACKLVESIHSGLGSVARFDIAELLDTAKRIKTTYNDQIAENFLKSVHAFFVRQTPDARTGQESRNRLNNLAGQMSKMASLLIQYGGEKGKSYSIDRLLEYLYRDVDIYQGIDSPSEALNLLTDYYRSLRMMRIKIKDWFPRSLHLAHDVAARNARVAAEEYDLLTFSNQVSSPFYQGLAYNPSQGKDQKSDGQSKEPYAVVIPTCPDDVVQEGTQLHHCVASYVGDIKLGRTIICFLREADALDVPLVTLEVNPETRSLVQYRGSCNRDLSRGELEWVRKWCRIKGLTMGKR